MFAESCSEAMEYDSQYQTPLKTLNFKGFNGLKRNSRTFTALKRDLKIQGFQGRVHTLYQNAVGSGVYIGWRVGVLDCCEVLGGGYKS